MANCRLTRRPHFIGFLVLLYVSGISVLIPDGESPFAYHVAACLAQVKDVKIHILSKKSNAPVRYSRATGSFRVLAQGEDLAEAAAEFCSRTHVDLIMPVDMEGIYYFAQRRERVERAAKLFLMESAENLRRVWDKSCLAHILREKRIPHPFTVTGRSEFEDASADLTFPVLIKPRLSGGGDGIVRYDRREELLARMDGNFFDRFLVQEYVEGENIDCSVLCRGGEILAYTVQKELYPNPEGYQPAEAVEFVHHCGAFERAAELMSALRWNGVAHIDMRIRASDGGVLIIELNPRYWGSIEGSLYAGVNFPYLALLASRGETFPRPAYRDGRYMSALAAFKRILRRQPALNLFRETNFWSNVKDPLPVIIRLINSL